MQPCAEALEAVPPSITAARAGMRIVAVLRIVEPLLSTRPVVPGRLATASLGDGRGPDNTAYELERSGLKIRPYVWEIANGRLCRAGAYRACRLTVPAQTGR